MAPVLLNTVDDDLKDVIQHLFEIQSAVHGYLRPRNATRADNSTTDSDQDANSNTDPSNPRLASIQLPPEIIDYVDSSRNPDIYTREFVELVQRGNQDLKGKQEAFAAFRDVLAREMRSAMPECAGEVDRVVAVTGGAGESNSNPNSNSA
ncbi:Mediator complex subunit Med10 [Penicillium hetheringtonii]|uniref:Mediator of RNA polymerase II transcription subunit 10 n=1 Tax=Penicillium hetheringtonii TaxID=911720 RepID=A0AAD6DEF8_9EURO|nr:Mediator complex subunit Med10 [Penicillium hetheringtonii]